jgi:hypothetical protein
MKRYDENDLASMRNFVAGLFRLENSRTNVQVAGVLAALRDWFSNPQHANLQRDFFEWARATILAKIPFFPADQVNDFAEAQAMLDDLTIEWKAEWKAEGKAEGRREGQAAMLLQLMRMRFGAVPPEVSARLENASEEQLYKWLERSISAHSIDALLHDRH